MPYPQRKPDQDGLHGTNSNESKKQSACGSFLIAASDPHKKDQEQEGDDEWNWHGRHVCEDPIEGEA